MTSWLTKGLPRQFWLMKENNRCSILFHLLVLEGTGPTEMCKPVSFASFCNSSFQSLTREPLLPPESAVISNLAIDGFAHRTPPSADALHGEGGRVVVNTHAHPASILAHVVDAIRSDSSQLGND